MTDKAKVKLDFGRPKVCPICKSEPLDLEVEELRERIKALDIALADKNKEIDFHKTNSDILTNGIREKEEEITNLKKRMKLLMMINHNNIVEQQKEIKTLKQEIKKLNKAYKSEGYFVYNFDVIKHYEKELKSN